MNLQEYKRIDISKDEILPLAERMKKEGRYRVMIHALINAEAFGRGRRCILFADAHTMSEAAQDVLLKTLEEPPQDTLLLLTGMESGMRPTILSRCMVLRTETEPWERIAERLMQNGTDRRSAQLAAKLSDGVYGRAEAFSRSFSAAPCLDMRLRS